MALAACGLTVLFTVPQAHADIITALNGPAVQVAGGYAYTYNVELTGEQQLDPVSNGVPAEFGTVYDFGTVVGGVAAIATTGILASGQFVFSLENTDTPAFETAPVDSALLQNIRFTYSGSTAYAVNTTTNANAVLLPSTVDNLGTFTVVSPYASAPSATLQYDGEAMKASNNTITGNVGLTTGPSLPTDVPEPASLTLLGIGLIGAGLSRRRRRD